MALDPPTLEVHLKVGKVKLASYFLGGEEWCSFLYRGREEFSLSFFAAEVLFRREHQVPEPEPTDVANTARMLKSHQRR